MIFLNCSIKTVGKNNIFLFTGDFTSLLRKNLTALKTKFIEKNGEHNLSVFDIFDKSTDLREIQSVILSEPFLAETRLIILYGYPFTTEIKINKSLEDFETNFINVLEKIPDSTTLICVSPKPDKRKKSFKNFESNFQIKLFKKDENSISEYIDNHLSDILGREERLYLANLVGTDDEKLMQEVEKIQIFADGAKVSKQDLETLVSPNIETGVFELTQMVLEQNKQGAINKLRGLIQKGEDLIALFNMIIWQMEQILFIKELNDKGYSEKLIAETTEIHPFVIKKVKYNINKFSLSQIKNIYKKLYLIDKKLKSGIISYSKDNSGELEGEIAGVLVSR